MSLSFADKAALALKRQEFRITPALASGLMPILQRRLGSPFRAEEDAGGYLFCHVPKTGGTSISQLLFNDRPRHIPLTRYFLFDSRKASSYFKFAVVRNPWSRLYSAYKYMHAAIGRQASHREHRWADEYLSDTPDFDAFVRKLRERRRFRSAVLGYTHFRHQLDWITVGLGMSRHIALDCLCRFESLNADFSRISSRLGVQSALPTMRVGDGSPYQDMYTHATRDFVYEIYRQDIEAFGYRFETVSGA